MPRGIPNRTVTAEDHIRQSPPVDLADPGASEIEVVPQIRTPEVELEAFMNEVLTIVCEESRNPNDTKHVEVAVNGRRIFIPRGVETNTGFDEYGRIFPVKRMYIERLARSKETSYSQDLDPRLGEGVNRLQPHRALTYPFKVVDDSPKGREWLKRILMER